MKNILLPTDFSTNSWNAITYALALYKDQECTFYLLHTYTPSIINSRYLATLTIESGIEDYGKINADNELERLLNRIDSEFVNKKHSFESSSSFSLLAEAIKELINTKAIDIIIMGTKGATGLEKIFMGGNTVRVIKAIEKCPVLAIPEFYENPLTEIAFATDLKRAYNKIELEQLINIASSFNASIRVVHVQTETELSEIQQFNLNLLLNHFDGQQYNIHIIPEKVSVSYRIQKFVEDMNISLLAMINYKHSFIEQLTREYVIKNIAFQTQVPFLVLPEISSKNVKMRI